MHAEVLDFLRKDLKEIFDKEIERTRLEERERVIVKLSPITGLLMEYMGYIIPDDADWSLILSRKNDSNSVNTFISTKLVESKIFDQFIATCKGA
jgi:hypothetical protein